MPHRDLYTLNSLIASHVRSGNAVAALSVFRRIHRAGSHLNSYTLTPVLAVLDPICGKQVHALAIKTGSDTPTVTKTALMDMYSKYGQLGSSVRVFEEVGFKDVVTWNTMLSSFVRHGRPEEALAVFREMQKEGVWLSEFTLCSLLKACTLLKAFQQGKQVHALVVVMGRDLVVLGTALIDFYTNVECIEEAMEIFHNLNWKKDDVMRNSLISGCVRNRRYKEAFLIMSAMRPNVVAVTSALAACSKNSDLWVGKQIHCVAIRFGFTFDTQLCNVLLDMYAKCGKILNARSLFDSMDKKDVVSWTNMIDAYGNHGHGLEALKLFKKMEGEGNSILPNLVTFLAVLSACAHSGKVEQGRECFNLIQEKYNLDPGPEHYACFIDILGRAGQIEEVWCLFNNMVKNQTKPTAAVWAAILNACSHNLDVSRGEFAAKNLLELEPNKPGNYVLLSNFYAAVGRWDSVNELRSIMRKKGLVKETGNSWVTVAHCHENIQHIN